MTKSALQQFGGPDPAPASGLSGRLLPEVRAGPRLGGELGCASPHDCGESLTCTPPHGGSRHARLSQRGSGSEPELPKYWESSGSFREMLNLTPARAPCHARRRHVAQPVGFEPFVSRLCCLQLDPCTLH